MASRTSSADVVRAWLSEQGEDVKGKRGRMKQSQIDKFNAAHKSAPYAPGGRVSTVKVTAMVPNSAGGKTPRVRNVVLADVRAAAADAGLTVSPKGRVSEAILQAYVTDTLPSLATNATV